MSACSKSVALTMSRATPNPSRADRLRLLLFFDVGCPLSNLARVCHGSVPPIRVAGKQPFEQRDRQIAIGGQLYLALPPQRPPLVAKPSVGLWQVPRVRPPASPGSPRKVADSSAPSCAETQTPLRDHSQPINLGDASICIAVRAETTYLRPSPHAATTPRNAATAAAACTATNAVGPGWAPSKAPNNAMPIAYAPCLSRGPLVFSAICDGTGGQCWRGVRPIGC